MVTINDIAKALGVAKSTVSNAITNNRYVNPELKEKILKKCEEMNFQPNFYAASLSKHKSTGIIGLFLELGKDPIYQVFYHQLIQSVVESSEKKEMNVLIYYGTNTEQVNKLLGVGRSPIDGAIILSPEIKDERYLKIEASQIPFVHIGKPSIQDDKLTYVDFDSKALVENIVNHLVDLGHKNILLINSKKDLTISIERTNYFKEVLKKRNIEFKEDMIIYSPHSTEVEGLEISKSYLKDKTAVITANDLLAYGVYEYLESIKKVVGKDVSVVALGGNKYIDTLKPKLSHAYQDYTKIGSMATKLLMNKITDVYFKPQTKIYKSELYLTDSIGQNLKG